MPDEVEEFLRRVNQMRAQAEAQARGQQQKPPQQKKKSKAERQQAARQQQQMANRPVASSLAPAPLPEVVNAELADRSDRVSRLVDDDLRGTQQIAEHTRRLGAEVDAADDKMAAHLHQVFDHKLGQLKSSATEAAGIEPGRSAAEMSADQVLRLLRSPASVRDAIVMAEVLRRPEW